MAAKDWGLITPDEQLPTRTLTDVNRPNFAEQDMREAEAQTSGFTDAVGTAFTSGSNVSYQAARMYNEITTSGPVDPAWDAGVDQFIKANRISPGDEWRFRATGNEKEANMLLARMEDNRRGREFLEMRGGVSSFVAEMMAGLIDVDAPLMLATGGLSKAARMGYESSKLGRIASGGLIGTASAGAIAAGSVAVNPNDDWSILPAMLLAGTALGSIGGALSGKPTVDSLSTKANTSMRAVHEEVGEHLATGMPTSKRPAQAAVDEIDPYGSRAFEEAQDALDGPAAAPRAPQSFEVEPSGADSAGAARVPGTGTKSINEIRSERIQNIVINNRQRDSDLGLETQIDDIREMRPISTSNSVLQNVNNALYNSAVRFSKIVSMTPAGNDFNKLINTETATGRVFAYDLFESPMGILRNNDNASRYFNDYKTQLLAQIEDTPDLYAAWARKTRQMNVAQATLSQETQEQFNREVIQELMGRFYGRRSGRAADDPVSKAADSYDRMYGRAADIERGRPGQGSVHGADNLQPKSGYVPQAWSGNKMRQLIEGGRTAKDISQAIYEAYRRNYSNKIKDSDLQIYSKAVTDRFLTSSDGSSVSISAWINADGRQAVEDFLTRQTGVTKERASAIIDGLTGDRRQRGKAGYLKERLDVDFSFKASNGIDMMDLLDTDLRGMAERRAHRSAGQAALARKGIKSRADYEAVVDAIVAEQSLNPKTKMPNATIPEQVRNWADNPKHLNKQDMMEMYNYFIGAPLYGGVSPMYATAKKLTNLSLLNQLGMAQMAEWGTNMAAVGARDFMRRLPDSFKASMRKKDSPLMQEMRQLGVYLPDDRLHRFDQTYSTEKLSNDDTAWFAKFNGVMNAGARLQGFTSLFYTMNRAQHHMAVDIAVTNMMKHFKGVKAMSDMRFRDAWGDMDPGMLNRMKHYAQNATYDGNGDVVNLNLNQWAIEDVEAFSRYINANTRQQVQRTLIGESNTNFHKDGFVGLFWHLKSFPLLALEKQFARNAMIGDAQALGGFMYGLGWATLAYTTKQILNGNTDNMSYDKIARGAIGMSNMTGWLPMWSDPVLNMLGMGDYGLSGFNGRGGTSIISVPAVIPTLDKMLQIPGALAGDGSSSDIRAIQSLPIIGNAYGLSAMFNHMKDNAKTSRRIQDGDVETKKPKQEVNPDSIIENAIQGTNIPFN